MDKQRGEGRKAVSWTKVGGARVPQAQGCDAGAGWGYRGEQGLVRNPASRATGGMEGGWEGGGRGGHVDGGRGGKRAGHHR